MVSTQFAYYAVPEEDYRQGNNDSSKCIEQIASVFDIAEKSLINIEM